MLQITQRTHPSMARIIPQLSGSTLHLAVDNHKIHGRSEIQIKIDGTEESSDSVRYVNLWGDKVKCIDQGDMAADFLAEFFGSPGVRLLRMAKAKRHLDPVFGEGLETSLADEFPLLVTSQESLKELNRRRVFGQQRPVEMNRFRPNVVVKGGFPFEEDSWHTLTQSMPGSITSDVNLRCVKPCERCSVPNVEQESGVATKDDVTKTLREHRSGRQCAKQMRDFLQQAQLKKISQVALQMFEGSRSSTFFGVHALAAKSTGAVDIDYLNSSLHVGDELVVDYGCY